MCMADDSFGRRVPFAFLQDLKEKFLDAYGAERAMQSPPYGLNEFARVIAKQMVTDNPPYSQWAESISFSLKGIFLNKSQFRSIETSSW